jgi:hypothetical protein
VIVAVEERLVVEERVVLKVDLGESVGGMMGGGPTMGGSNESGTMGGGSTGRSDGEVGAAEKKDPNQDVFNTRLISRVLPLIVLALISNNFTRPSRCLLAQT